MKTAITLAVFFLVLSAGAFAQNAGYISAQAAPTRFMENPLHASPHEMAPEQTLLGSAGTSPYHFAEGEQPVWQFGEIKPTQPLGDIARAYRKEHMTITKRAEFVWEN